MSLTLEIEHLLKKKGFDTLYNKYESKWNGMANKAHTYTRDCIPDDEKVRPGDVSENLQNAIKIDPAFEEYLGRKGLTQKYWIRHFSDYILEQIYPTNIKE